MQAYSWIAGALGTADRPNQTASKQLQEGATVYELFSELAGQYPDFREQVFNPETGKLTDQIMIILNGRLVQEHEMKSTRLNNKDKITLSPVLVGG